MKMKCKRIKIMKKDNDMKKESIDFVIKNIDMFSAVDYERLEAQIEGHRYFLGTRLDTPISWDEAAYSWMENVFLPISEVMETWTTSMSFPGRRRADVFFELCDHLYFLSLRKRSDVDIYDAVLDYDAKFGRSIGRILARILGGRRAA
jgi:hypothetical protein